VPNSSLVGADVTIFFPLEYETKLFSLPRIEHRKHRNVRISMAFTRDGDIRIAVKRMYFPGPLCWRQWKG